MDSNHGEEAEQRTPGSSAQISILEDNEGQVMFEDENVEVSSDSLEKVKKDNISLVSEHLLRKDSTDSNFSYEKSSSESDELDKLRERFDAMIQNRIINVFAVTDETTTGDSDDDDDDDNDEKESKSVEETAEKEEEATVEGEHTEEEVQVKKDEEVDLLPVTNDGPVTDSALDSASVVSEHEIIQPSSEAEKQIPHALSLFRRIAREVWLMCRICMRFRVGSSYFMENLKTDTGYEGESDEEDKEEESAISFDVNYFKPNKNRLAYKMVKIAKKHPEWRTREELESLCSVLRSLISIRHCSKPYQLVLAKVMRYERYRRRRIVLKRGHYPQCCYFVFSGGISFTLDVDGSSAFENEQSPHLQKGGRFGVIPLLKNRRRQYTAVCMEETELMVVDKEDFYAYKLNEPLQQESVFRFQFFRSLELLSSVSDQHIEILCDSSSTEEFLYGQVIPHDGHTIIFVISGHFIVLRLVDLTKCSSYHKWIHQELPCLKKIMSFVSPEAAPFANRLLGEKESQRKYSTKLVSSPYGEVPLGLAVAIFMRIDTIQPTEVYGLNQYMVPESQKDHRSLKIKSQGVVITRMGKETLAAVADEETMEKVEKMQSFYPRDEKLCEYFLEKNSWKIFKKDLVAHLAKKSHQHISQPKCSWKKQEETVYDVDKTGILNLPAIAKQPVTAFLKPSYYIASVKSELEDSSHEVPELRLIHGIAMTRPPLKRL
eukprot:gi/632947339/ref/XP_007888999.1/ PREDICTED: cyclic nucleotide-binding domain-containing protein 2 [Callorhinchus milii]